MRLYCVCVRVSLVKYYMSSGCNQRCVFFFMFLLVVVRWGVEGQSATCSQSCGPSADTVNR